MSHSAAARADSASEPPQTAAAWVGRQPGSARVTGLLDLRAFYHYVAGVGPPRKDWSGGELLSYFDLYDGLSGAFILRHEARDQIANYATFMLIPRLTSDTYLVTSFGAGNGADFMPVTRLDFQVRGFLPIWRKAMYDVGGYSTWWTQGRRQLAQSDALILWYNPYIVELRYTSLLTLTETRDWRYNFQTSAVFLYGAHRQHWLLLRIQAGTEPENFPGRAFSATRDLLALTPAVGYRHWITPDYGVSGELEGFHQVETWSRIGATIAMFATF